MRRIILCLGIFTYSISNSIAGSISSGTWVRLKITKQGIYRLGYNDLANAGFNMSTLDPRKLQLRGHQGGMLPEANANRKTGLPEIPIWVEGESDGSFDAGDYVLFYAGAAQKWSYVNADKSWSHNTNDYEQDAYLYLGAGNTNGSRISQLAGSSQTPLNVITQYDYVLYHDSDVVNPVSMGRTWLGEKLGNETLTRDFSYNLPTDAVDSARVKVAFAEGMIDVDGSLAITINGVKKTMVCSAIIEEYEAFREGQWSTWVKTGGQRRVDCNLQLTRPNTQSAAWLNYIEIETSRDINVSGKPLVIRSAALQESTRVEVRIGGSGLRVWAIDNEMSPVEFAVNSGSGYSYIRTDSANVGKTFVAFNPSDCYVPEIAGAVQNADILLGPAVNFIIVTHPDFMDAAQKLAGFRTVHDGYSVKVVTPQAIYNEYSASMQDIVAIRDYIRDEYNKSDKAGTALKYVLIMGAASYDFKNRVTPNSNFVPIYEDYSSQKNATFCLDDFYGYLDSNMGRPTSDPYNTNKLKVAIGRITCRTKTEASGTVDKIIRYSDPGTLGPWRSELAFVCDDVDQAFEDIFLQESEQYTTTIAQVHPEIQVDKIYSDAFKQYTNGNTEQYPDVMDAIDNTMAKGALFMNYQGHGGEKGWAQEGILTIPMVNAWKNTWTMPVLFTATCEFSRYDDPGFQSAGELSLLNPNGGAIALMTTTRLVYVSGNSDINYNFWTNYGFPKPNEPIPTVGDLFKTLKNRPSPSTEDNKFALLGDPSMRLAFPQHHVVLDSINGNAADTNYKDTLKAFSVVRIKGHIQQRLGGLFSSFNGKLWVKVLDKPQTRYTLDNDHMNKKMAFKDQTSLIYKGIVSVENGQFSIVFAVPKDISYNVDYGKILLYAHNGETDACGARQVLIGGSESNIKPDDRGPDVRLYMNDTTFVDGGQVQPNATFIAKVKDSSGINSTGAGIGRDIIGILDKGYKQEKTFVMNEFFAYDLNSYTSGSVYYNLKDLSLGEHTMTFKVWDIHNNSSESEIRFVVVPQNKLKVSYQNVYPNPFSTGNDVTILFEHNKAGESLKAELLVYDMLGNSLKSQVFDLDNTLSRETRVFWDGRNANGSELPNGMFMFKLNLTAEDGSRAQIMGKMMKN